MQVYAFAQIPHSVRELFFNEIHSGKSRFGMWEQTGSLREEENWFGAHTFLLRIKPGDWIVHVNFPSYGQCVAAQVAAEYDFDEGIQCDWDTNYAQGKDFNNFIPIDPTTILQFDRNDKRVLPSVNLRPLRRAQRVLEVEDFLKSLHNLRHSDVDENNNDLRGVFHLKTRVEEGLLEQLTVDIHKMNHSKDFERFLHEVFQNIPYCESQMNGFRWGTDYGADLLVEFQNPMEGINITTKLVIQAKSYIGDHRETNAVDQLLEGIQKYKADGGVLITTGNSTEELEEYIKNKATEIEKPIDLIAGPDVARFVIRHAPHLLLG